MTSAYYTIRDKDKKGDLQYYILQKEHPHYVGMVCTTPKEGALVQSAIAGYNLWIVNVGTLRGNMIPNYIEVLKEMQVITDTMAVWYYADRIALDKKRFEKFKIKTNDTSSK